MSGSSIPRDPVHTVLCGLVTIFAVAFVATVSSSSLSLSFLSSVVPALSGAVAAVGASFAVAVAAAAAALPAAALAVERSL